jgi:hypothetical protein
MAENRIWGPLELPFFVSGEIGTIIMSLSEPLGSKKAARRDRKETVAILSLFQGHTE